MKHNRSRTIRRPFARTRSRDRRTIRGPVRAKRDAKPAALVYSCCCALGAGQDSEGTVSALGRLRTQEAGVTVRARKADDSEYSIQS
eukprot:15468025-Alexandrium_andersonii.AAC.1